MKRVMTSRSFRAQFRRMCVCCEQEIYVGELVKFDPDDNLVHAEHPGCVPRPAAAICPTCSLEMPMTGECC